MTALRYLDTLICRPSPTIDLEHFTFKNPCNVSPNSGDIFDITMILLHVTPQMLVKSKDDVINKLVISKRQSDGAMVTLQAETAQHKDESKRLLGELNTCIKQLKQCENEVV